MYKIESVIIIICGLFCAIHAKYILSVHIYNYQNLENLKHDGSKCESFHWAGDHCDPIFEICITMNKGCDILNRNISFWKNKKTIYTVLSQEIPLDNINMNQSITFKVKVDDEDQYLQFDHIAVFSANFQINTLNYIYKRLMDVTPKGLNVQLQLSASLKCAKNYSEPNCEMKTKLDYQCNPKCDHGSCVLNKDRITYSCSCENGWTGSLCSLKANTYTTELFTSKPLTESNTISESRSTLTLSTYTMTFFSESLKITQLAKHGQIEPVSNSLSTTIIIIGLLIFLCISVIALLVVIRNFQRQNKKHSINVFQRQRPLPPIFYKDDKIHHETLFLPQIGGSLKTTSNIEYEAPVSPNKDYDLCDPYEEPIINHMESLTFETDCNSQNSDEYLKPVEHV